MNWYRQANKSFTDMNAATAAVQRALNRLQYLKPEVDPSTADLSQLAADLAEIEAVPAGVNPERFAAMVVWHLKNGGEGEL